MTPWDRLVFGLCALWIAPSRRQKVSVVFRPSTFQRFHDTLLRCKYRLLFSAKGRRKPGPKGPEKELIEAVVAMKRQNPRFGCLKIAQEITHAFGVEVNKDVVRRILEKHYDPSLNDDGPSWLSTIGHIKDSLWSMDLFRCESILLQSFWVMVVIDVFTRRFIGFAVERGDIDGVAVCRMFNCAISKQSLPKYLSTDNDPLFRFHRWLATLRILDIEEIKTVALVPCSHPFVERAIRTVREELLDQVLFWNQLDLERKLSQFLIYYNGYRVHSGIDGVTPEERGGSNKPPSLPLNKFCWISHCHGLFKTPVAA
jgi:hypothetical protein